MIVIAHGMYGKVLVIVGPLFLDVDGSTNAALWEPRDATRHCRTLRPRSSVTLGSRVTSMLLAGGYASSHHRAYPSSAIVPLWNAEIIVWPTDIAPTLGIDTRVLAFAGAWLGPFT